MSISIALRHRTRYRYDRPVSLSPHEIRLRPAPHCRTPVSAYSLNITPEPHFINWQQDIHGNHIARVVFPEKTRELEITVGLVADMTVINPFDFFIADTAARFPFVYDPADAPDLAPYLAVTEEGQRLERWVADLRIALPADISTIDFLVEANRRLQADIRYLVRMEPGVQGCEQTLALGSGSCRDSGWLLVQILRRCGIAARFVSGYLVQLKPDLEPLAGPSGPESDFTDLHAWAEAYVPGAGWIGLDPTSGLLAGEGHIPLACASSPPAAAPVTGFLLGDPCESRFDFEMSVTRLPEHPRVTLPYTEPQWQAMDALGLRVDAELKAGDVRLTQGGEPTFVAMDDMDGEEWNYTALSPAKRALAETLQQRLQRRFAPGGLLHFGQGKWYPGEPLPRWALGVYWRRDGKPLWQDPSRVAMPDMPPRGGADARRLLDGLAQALGLGLHGACIMPAFEADDAGGADTAAAWVLPLRAHRRSGAADPASWQTSRWPLARLVLVGGDSEPGYRLPLNQLPKPDQAELDEDAQAERDPFESGGGLIDSALASARDPVRPGLRARGIVRTALVASVRDGMLHLFMPPLPVLEDYLALLAAVESVSGGLGLPLRIEGYAPPRDARLQSLAVTPDPGVIEVNIHPAADWPQLVATTTALYEDARQMGLGTEKFMIDGRHTGTGGGNHVTLGGAEAADSPMLRRPDLLRSLITCWQRHPALSYVFAGMFVGPTSQAPRVDEARNDSLYELEIAFQQLAQQEKLGSESERPWLIDRLLRNLLIDVTGNTHRAEFCIDKLYSPSGPTGRLGLLELRAFEMPPHPRMSLAQMLLLRALVAYYWRSPCTLPLLRWGTALHDRYMLPHFLAADLHELLDELRGAGYAFDDAWFEPFLEFRFPRCGRAFYGDIALELRQAIEPWHVLGEEVALSGTSRYVDSSVERLQVCVTGLREGRHAVTCNGRPIPLHAAGGGVHVAGVRYRAWHPPSALHPTIGVHTPLVFDIVDIIAGRSLGGCTYHVAHPGGRNYDTFPVNASEAEARRRARFEPRGHTSGPVSVTPEPANPDFPYTLDLRREPV